VQVDEQLHHAMVEVLDEVASRQLFRQSAGLRGDPEASLREVEAAILAACGGLPLALCLIGSQLYKSKDEASWKVMLRASMCGRNKLPDCQCRGCCLPLLPLLHWHSFTHAITSSLSKCARLID
jgi:hypothetical protein